MRTDHEKFLNSVLSSINDRKSRVVASTINTHPNLVPESNREANTVAFRKNSQPHPNNTSLLSNKRKAESELVRLSEKAQRIDDLRGKPSSSSTTPRKAAANGEPTLKVSAVSQAAYKGTGRARPVTPVSTETKAPPKKGSFAEIMARGKPTIAPVGVITHKPKVKLSSKKELEELQKREKALKGKPGGKILRSAPGSKSNSPGPSKRKNGDSSSRKPAKPAGYQGTAKPQTSYKGTIKPLPSLPASVHKNDHDTVTTRLAKIAPKARHKETNSDEESKEDEEGSYVSEEDEEGSYVSEEDYSDMEAGFEDVEEEDEKAARLAKKEDDYEKMMIDELKRQKEAKKQRLVALAEKARRRR